MCVCAGTTCSTLVAYVVGGGRDSVESGWDRKNDGGTYVRTCVCVGTGGEENLGVYVEMDARSKLEQIRISDSKFEYFSCSVEKICNFVDTRRMD